ncbi:MAG: hypothetical protein JJU02_04645 [Cryomorphaceae bacterium]|nr:hypothetical protein [Cryomorphaceae bacterium]
MKRFYFWLLPLFIVISIQSPAQNYFLRGNAGVLSTFNSYSSSAYFNDRQYSFAGGLQLHKKLRHRTSVSIGLYSMQYDKFYLTLIGCDFENGKTYYYYDQVKYNHFTIPVLWHKQFGKNDRFEYSLGSFYSRAFGAQNLTNNSEWRYNTRDQPFQIGFSIGFQYAIIQFDKLDIAVSYRSFMQVYSNEFRSTPMAMQDASSYMSSFLSLNCTMPL